MSSTFTEYTEVELSAPLRQGDVLEAADAAAPPWSRLLLVITADCDLAFNKNRDLVTCVPIVEKDRYLLEIVAPAIRERTLKLLIAALRGVLAEFGYPNVTESRIREWVVEAETVRILDDLSASGSLRAQAERWIDALRAVVSPSPTIPSLVSALVDAESTLQPPPKPDRVRSRILSELRAPFSRPPGDALFLGAVGPGMDAGYFAYLRSPQQLDQSLVATTPGRADTAYRRIAKLQDRFTHALVQRFALVFMSIGLPVEYEELRDLHASLLGETD